MSQLFETDLTVISENTRLEGTMRLAGTTRISGTLKGEINADKESRIIVEESGLIEGKLQVETLLISGAVLGDIVATQTVHLTSTGRIVGTVTAPQFIVDFGGKFEGQAKTGTPR